MSLSGPQPLRKFVRAGAGAGKTYNLTREVVKLALDFHQQTGQWPRTVLTTFTRKATQELKERMLLYCLQERPEAVEFVQSTSYLNITTMHGLLNNFLSRFGYGVGLPNQLKIVDAQQANFWRKQILRKMIANYKDSESLQIFNFETLLDHLRSYESVYWQKNYRPLQTPEDFQAVYGQWMLRKAKDLEYWVSEAQEQVEGEKWDEYFAQMEGFLQALKTPSPWQQWQEKLSAHLAEIKKPRPSKKASSMPDELKKAYDKCFNGVKKSIQDPDLSPEYWPKTIKVLKDFKVFADDFVGQLIEKKQSEGALEPNDLEFFSLKLLQDRPELITKFSAEVDAWFIDEFQDTSPLQMQLLEPMIGDSSCYIVGDPQQSIYLFRGSRSEVFFEKSEKMAAEGADMAPLQDNYRSQENLLEFFNSFFPSLHHSFSTMSPKVEAEASLPAVKVTHITGDESNTELYQLTQELSTLINQGVLAKDICVLTRTHKQSDELQKTLMSLGFPVISHSSDKFYERREVIDGLALLKFLVNPWDDKNLLILMRSPWIGLSDQQILNIIGDKDSHYWTRFKDYFLNETQKGPGLSLCLGRRQIESKGYAWVFRRLLIQLGMLDYSHNVDSTGRREANLWKLINVVERNAREPGTSLLQLIQQGHLSSSLEDFGDSGDASSPVEPNKIHLMTVHASKGLQFDYVFLPFMEKKPRVSTWLKFSQDSDVPWWSFRMPLSDPTSDQGGALEKLIVETQKEKELDESLRVLYVAMTRAKKQLIMSWSGEPEDSSWAAHLMAHQTRWKDHPHIQFQEITSQQASAFREEGRAVEVPSPFDSSIDRFIEGETTTNEDTSTPPTKNEWSEVIKGQQRRRDGVILHRIFESLKNHSVDETKHYCRDWLPGRESEMEEAIDFLFTQQEVPIGDIIQQGHVEWGYRKPSDDGGTVEKRIDLWGVVDETLWVVDYKTGSDRYRDKAFKQMAEYAETLKSYLKWSGNIQRVAVYPFSKTLYVKSGL